MNDDTIRDLPLLPSADTATVVNVTRHATHRSVDGEVVRTDRGATMIDLEIRPTAPPPLTPYEKALKGTAEMLDRLKPIEAVDAGAIEELTGIGRAAAWLDEHRGDQEPPVKEAFREAAKEAIKEATFRDPMNILRHVVAGKVPSWEDRYNQLLLHFEELEREASRDRMALDRAKDDWAQAITAMETLQTILNPIG